MLILRFDLRRAPFCPVDRTELYRAALDMAAWVDGLGAPANVMFSQHHGSPDGYLPSPLILAAGAAARTTVTSISVGALLVLMYDPVKLAEDLCVLDQLSAGHVDATVGLGYRDAEYAMFGVDRSRRGAEMDERLDVLVRAMRGERLEWRGRSIHVTPEPWTEGGPRLAYGGGSRAAARRAVRFGLPLVAERHDADLPRWVQEAADALHLPEVPCLMPPAGSPTSVFVSSDPDRTWDEIGPYLLHDARAYAAWMGPHGAAASFSRATTVAELRAEAGPYAVLTPEQATELLGSNGFLALQPLCGGIPPELAWTSLELAVGAVLGVPVPERTGLGRNGPSTS